MLRELLGVEGRSAERMTYESMWNRGLDAFTNNRSAGVTVTTRTATQLTAVYGSWRILSEGIGQLPVGTFRDRDGVPFPTASRPRWLDDPNPATEWPEFAGEVMVSLLGDGNAYIATQRNRLGDVEEMYALDPAKFEPEMRGGRLMFRSGLEWYDSSQILHIPGMRRPGDIKGISPIDACRDTLGLGLAAQTYGGSFFEKDGTPSVVITAPHELSANGIAAAKRAWREAHAGPDKAGSVAVLTEGATFQAVAVTPEQAQFLETRRFQVADIARIYGVPPHLLQDATNSTSWGSGLAEQTTNYVVHSLAPWVNRLEARFSRLLFGNQYVKFDVEGLLRGDHTTRWETHRQNVAAGLVSRDEVRLLEGKPPIPGGEGATFMAPLNLGPVGGSPDA